MPGAARNRGRRRAAAGDGVRTTRRARYRFIERDDGVRIERATDQSVDLRIAGQQIAISGARRRSRCSIFTPSVGLARLVAAALLDLPHTAANGDYDAIRREIWALGPLLDPVRRRLLDRHAADFSAVEQRMLEIRGTVPRLARAPLFYRTPYLARDVCRFRAAAIALAFLEDELWPHPPAADGQAVSIPKLYRVMRSWRGLFAPSAEAYRSLDRTVMNLPDGIYPALVCVLRHVRLERPITDPVELNLVLECVALARQRRHTLPWLHALQHAPAAAIRAGFARIAAATHRDALDPFDPTAVRFVATYLLDAQTGAAERFEHVVGHAVRRHAELQRRPPAIEPVREEAVRAPLRRRGEFHGSLAADTPTAMPPVPLPDVPGLQFLATVGEVFDEGRRMRHCVGLYATRAARGDCFLFHAEHDGASASIEVGAEGRVRQAAGPGNRHNAACTWGRRQLECWVATWPAQARAHVDSSPYDELLAEADHLREMLEEVRRRARTRRNLDWRRRPRETLH